MRLDWFKRRKKPSPSEVGARCPNCHCSLPIMYEQAMLLAGGKLVWLFCPVCMRIVAVSARLAMTTLQTLHAPMDPRCGAETADSSQKQRARRTQTTRLPRHASGKNATKRPFARIWRFIV